MRHCVLQRPLYPLKLPGYILSVIFFRTVIPLFQILLTSGEGESTVTVCTSVGALSVALVASSVHSRCLYVASMDTFCFSIRAEVCGCSKKFVHMPILFYTDRLV